MPAAKPRRLLLPESSPTWYGCLPLPSQHLQSSHVSCCTYCVSLQEAQSSCQDSGVSTAGPSLRKVVSGFPSLAVPWNLRSSLCIVHCASSSLPAKAPVKYMDSPGAQPTEDLVNSFSSFDDSCLSYRGFSLFLLFPIIPQKEPVGIGEMVQQLVLAAQS